MSEPQPTPSGAAAAPRHRWLAGGAAGLLAGVAAVAVSEAIAAVVTGVTSPLLAVGNRAVDATPRPLKEFAIERFGSNDKPVLIGGVILTVALLAVLLGAVGVRRPRLALGGFVALSLVAVVAAVTDRTATAGVVLRVLPALALLVVGAVALLLLLRALRTPPHSWHPTTEPATGTPAGAREVLDSARRPHARETVEDGKPRLLVGDLLPAHVEGDDLPAGFDRRGFLQTAVAVGAVAAVGGAVRQGFGGSAAAAARGDVTLPKPATAAPSLASGTSFDVPGISPFLTSNRDFYRVDTALACPTSRSTAARCGSTGWSTGSSSSATTTCCKRRLIERRITLTCVSNQVGGKLRRQRQLARRSRSATS